jgi:O-6-methylguanine DNA methyltransferase
MDFNLNEFESPVGIIYVITDKKSLRAVDFSSYEERMHRLLKRHYGEYTLHPNQKSNDAASRLKAYFSGDIRAIEGIPTATNGTDFQKAVWAALCTIPAGTTLSYGALAAKIGRPKASRAIGLANGSNPIGIFVPCHRVIGSNHSLTGYGGGIERKKWLLQHEGVEVSDKATKSEQIASNQPMLFS